MVQRDKNKTFFFFIKHLASFRTVNVWLRERIQQMTDDINSFLSI